MYAEWKNSENRVKKRNARGKKKKSYFNRKEECPWWLVSRLDMAEKRIMSLERWQQKLPKPQAKMNRLYKRCNICIMGILEGEERGKRKEEISTQ